MDDFAKTLIRDLFYLDHVFFDSSICLFIIHHKFTVIFALIRFSLTTRLGIPLCWLCFPLWSCRSFLWLSVLTSFLGLLLSDSRCLLFCCSLFLFFWIFRSSTCRVLIFFWFNFEILFRGRLLHHFSWWRLGGAHRFINIFTIRTITRIIINVLN